MENKPLTAAQLRQRKFLLVLPVFIIPFLILGVWALGLGKGKAAEQTKDAGLNTTMPKAVLKDEKGFTKMSFYDEVQQDSVKLHEQQKNDPFFFKKSFAKDSAPTLSNLSKYSDPNEQKVYEKLAELNTVIHQQQQPQAPGQVPPTIAEQPVNNNADLSRLEQLMHNMKEQNDDDTEMQRLSNMMDKIIAIQHPNAVKDTPRKKVVDTAVIQPAVVNAAQVGFYGTNDAIDINSSNTIKAMVAENQTLVTGATIKLLLQQDIFIKGQVVAKSNFVYGTVALSNERLKVNIASVRAGNNIIPVSLEAYDMDGLAGIYVPGSISRDVAKQSADEGMNGVGLTTLDPSIGAQAASAGIQAAKSLIGKKVRLVKVTVRAGYQLLLIQTN